jgi:hypothetical protein
MGVAAVPILQFCLQKRASSVRCLVSHGSSPETLKSATKLSPLYISSCISTVLELFGNLVSSLYLKVGVRFQRS